MVDSGFRCHLTNFVRTTAAEPSAFVRRLRKALGTKRVTSVSQVGTDRIIEFQFSGGVYRLFLEFYAGGNIVLTDKELNIVALLRNVADGAEHEKIHVGVEYNLDLRQNYGFESELSISQIKERWLQGLSQADSKEKGDANPKKKPTNSLRRLITQTFRELHPVLVDHVLFGTNCDPSAPPEAVSPSSELLEVLCNALKEALDLLGQLSKSENVKGYIIAKVPSKDDQNTPTDAPSRLMYDDFHPFRPRQLEDVKHIQILEYETYNKTVDEFFSSIEGQKLDSRLQERQSSATKKIESVRKQHEERLESLQKVGELNIRKAQAIEANIERVGEAADAVNGLIAQGRDWADMARLIESEQSRGNPVAQLIKLPLKLYENTVTLLLAEPEVTEDDSGYISGSDDEVDSEDEGRSPSVVKSGSANESKRLAIDIDLSLSPWANATQYYDQKRTAADKEQRTAQASNIAIKSAEKKINADLKKGLKQEKDILRPIRQPYWFEKFYYFISSDRYLVLSGKDAQQNDLLYQKYLKGGDIFVYADINQAAIVIIRNNPDTPNAPIPPSTLSQAASLCVATSTAWDSKAMMAAWWVSASQVSKTSPSGDYLGPGHFHISGEKNYLPPSPLLVGLAIVFEISEASVTNHTKHHVEDTTTGDVKKRESVESEPPSQEPTDLKPDGEDSDDFPDAAPHDGMDSDDEFPDVDPNAGMDSEDDGDDTGPSNPLQGDVGRDVDDSSNVHLPTRPSTQGAQTNNTTPAKPQSEDNKRRHQAPGQHDDQKRMAKPKDESSFRQSIDGPTSTPPARDSSIPRSTTSAKSASTAAPLPRGKRTKLKKAAAKYADQDEADRAAALARLGSAAGAAQKATAAADQRERDRAAAEEKQRRREAHFRAAAEAEAARQRARAAAAPGAEGASEAQDDEDEGEGALRTAPLHRLVGRPAPGDEIVSAWTVCAPWAALAAHKFRAKMQPGGEKKGRAAREVLARWRADAAAARGVDPAAQDPGRVWPRERELIEGLRDADAVGALFVGKVRVMMPGGGAAAGGKQAGGARGKGKAARGGKGSKRK
jgi:predicted ribosome quality control (RQC) complex YloA/Tae2 family protein